MPVHIQIVKASLPAGRENDRGHLVQYLPIQVSGYYRGQDAVEKVDRPGATSQNTGNQRKDQMILQGGMVRVCA